MNEEILKQALAAIDGELMKGPISNEELEDLKKTLLFKVHFIEQMQTREVA